MTDTPPAAMEVTMAEQYQMNGVTRTQGGAKLSDEKWRGRSQSKEVTASELRGGVGVWA